MTRASELLTVAECARIAGIKHATWRAYVARGQAPPPVEHISRTPLWNPTEVHAWQAARGKQ